MSVALVMLPDMMCDARVFLHQIKALSADTAVMVAPVTQESRIEAIASGLLKKLPTRFALLGLGFGGIVAMDILRQAPERVDRICLMDTYPLQETPDRAAAREPMIVRAQAGRLEDVLIETCAPAHLAPGPQHLEVATQLLQMGLELGTDVYVRQSRAMQRRSDHQSTLRRCRAPGLVVCGAQDTLTPVKRHIFLAELMPSAQLQIVEGAGHVPPMERPEAVTAILRDWLKQPMVLR